MNSTIVPLMQCITCGRPLRIERADGVRPSGDIAEGAVACDAGHTWPIEAGVLAFSREDALSDSWTRSYPTYESYAEPRAREVEEARDEVAPILDRMPDASSDPVLELCTGHGGLLFNLLSQLPEDTQIVAVDMSLTIQMHNRRYMLEQYGDRDVSFIACDATTLPFQDGVIPYAVAYGMGNMLHQFPQGVRETARVVAEGGTFLFTHQYVEEDSEGWSKVVGLMDKLGADDFHALGIEEAFLELMRDTSFGSCEVEVTDEIVGDPDRDLDAGIFPYPNEKLWELVVTAVKPAS